MAMREAGVWLLAALLCCIAGVAVAQGVSEQYPCSTCLYDTKHGMVSGPVITAGTARVVDGDTLELAGQRVRIWGIDAPEHGQMCESGDWMLSVKPPRPLVYECGRDATAVLAELTRDRTVTCEQVDRDHYKRIVARCRTEAGDIGAEMVRRGWAVDYTRYSKGAYAAEQREAQQDMVGMWSGRFVMPDQWRRGIG